MALAAAPLTRLAAELTGSLLLPEDPEYVTCRLPFLARLDEVLPRAVVRAATAADVRAGLSFAREHGLNVAVRSGGHSFADRCSTDGLLLDLGGLRDLRTDGDLVTAGPGLRMRDLRRRLAQTGRTVSCGWCPDVALGGAVLGGGYGSLSRLYGLGSDHLVAAEVVLADGRTVWCDADREPDLFWALRGAGGGLLGVVTQFVLRTRPTVPATFFECRWPVRHAAEIIGTWLGWAPEAPDEINAGLGLIAPFDPAEAPYVVVFGLSVGAGTGFLDRFTPAPEHVDIRDLPAPAAAAVNYPDSPDDLDVTGPPWGISPGRRLTRSEFFAGSLPPGVVEALVDHMVTGRVAGQARELEFIPWGGAYGHVAPDATAFVHRRARFILRHTCHVFRRGTDAVRQDAQRWVNRSWEIAHPSGSGLIYPNYPEPGRSPLDPAYHGDNLDRIRRVVARYDPGGVFTR
ncbi:FAD-binding protein [Polymorphospora rubra]|uniref:FAD-binding PCMH-type domain-containing protein n=1 Tax=Polymorphospora rubra TaxID=338584 RepID=A0A810NCN1_9ACTN|nr:FAD-binding protein [Polymorphospora rubra]BCJ69628.1 hypothetical protein Prubr_66490 [Polymorphospora rubra]